MIDLVVGKTWQMWEPKKGRYAGRKFYIKAVLKPVEAGSGLHDIIKSSIKGSKIYMHKSTITDHQFINNCRSLNPREVENIPLLEDKYKEYKNHRVNLRTKKQAKRMLLK